MTAYISTLQNWGLYFLLACLLALSVPRADAATEEAPDVMIQRISKEIIHIATNDKEIQAGNRQRIMKVVEEKILPHADFDRATALVMGRHWRTATPEQKERLTTEFRNLILHTYAGTMSQIKENYPLQFLPMRNEPGDTDVVVRFEVRQPRASEPVRVSYRVGQTPDGWKIYDVNILGAWMSETYKNSFSTEIGKNGIDGLIRVLAEKNKKLAAGGAAAEKAERDRAL